MSYIERVPMYQYASQKQTDPYMTIGIKPLEGKLGGVGAWVIFGALGVGERKTSSAFAGAPVTREHHFKLSCAGREIFRTPLFVRLLVERELKSPCGCID